MCYFTRRKKPVAILYINYAFSTAFELIVHIY